jgi:iron complex outermembrane recepter protein
MKSVLYHSTAGIAAVLMSGMGGTAWAQDAAAEGAAVDAGEIIVTARRTEERLQDVPISITVYSQEQLDQRNIVQASDLAIYTPSLSVNQRYGPEKSSFAIRGFNQDQSTAPTVGVYFAEVVGPRAQGGTTSGNSVGPGAFMDLQNVQVLKGPQGTLFGRNTTGGAVLLVPNRPSDRLEGWVEGQVGSYNLVRASGMFNIPISDNLKVRAVVDRNHREGYMRNQSGIGPKDYNDVNYFAARLSVLADLSPNVENYTIFSYSNSFGHGYAGPIVACNRALVPGDPLFNVAAYSNQSNFRAISTAGPACDQIERADARGDSLLDVDVANPDPYIKLEQWQVINHTTWQVSDNFRIRNIISYGQFRERASFSLYSDNFSTTPGQLFPAAPVGTPFSYILLNPAGNEDNASQATFTEELQFQGNSFDGRFDWQFGAYFEKATPLGWTRGFTAQYLNCADIQTFDCGAVFQPIVTPGNISDSKTKLTFENIGFYAQGTFDITNWFSFTAGIRYTIDKIHGQNESTRVLFDTVSNGGGMIGRVCNDSFRFNVPDGPDPDTQPDPLAVTDGSQCHFELTQKSERPTWLLGLDFKPTDDILLYAKYARGYRQGGMSFTNVGRETWEPEKVDSYEIGAKVTFRGGGVNGYFNVAGFYNDFTDQQVFSAAIGLPGTGIAGGAVILNAGKSRIQGIEVDTSINLFDNSLRLDLGYTYLDTLVQQITAPPAANPFALFIPQVAQGGPLVLSPKHRLTLSANYTLPLDPSIGRISVGGTYVYTDEQLSNSAALGIAPDPLSPYRHRNIGSLPATNIVNLNVNWDGVMGLPVDAAFFVTNVTNEIYPVQYGNGYSSAGFETLIMGQPRMYGFKLKVHFGGDDRDYAPPPPPPPPPPGERG